MAKSHSDTATSGEKVNGESKKRDAELNGALGNNGASESLEAEYAELVTQAKHWIEENQSLAILGGFGFGVFIGVLLRR